MHPITEYFSSNSSDPCNIASCTMKALDWRVSTVQFSEPFPPQSFTPPSPGVSTLACTFGFLLFDCRAIPQWPTWCGTKFMLWGTACQGKDPKVFKITYNHRYIYLLTPSFVFNPSPSFLYMSACAFTYEKQGITFSVTQVRKNGKTYLNTKIIYNTGPVGMWLTLGTLQRGGASSINYKEKITSIHRYEGSSQGFTDIKQVSGHSIQVCRGSMGINAWNTFFLS